MSHIEVCERINATVTKCMTTREGHEEADEILASLLPSFFTVGVVMMVVYVIVMVLYVIWVWTADG